MLNLSKRETNPPSTKPGQVFDVASIAEVEIKFFYHSVSISVSAERAEYAQLAP